MKKYIPTILLIFLILTSCRKLDKFTQFNMEYNEFFTIPESELVNVPVNFLSPDIESNSTYEFEINETREDLIEEIILSSLSFEIQQPDSISFSYLKYISAYIVADGLEGQIIAWLNDIPENIGSTLNLETSDKNLMEFIKRNNFALVINTLTDEAIPMKHDVKMHAVFRVDAKVLGQ